MSAPTIAQLTEELQALAKALKPFKENNFSVFDTQDLDVKGATAQWPVLGVMYDGAINPPATNAAAATGARAHSASIVTAQFTIVIGIKYDYGAKNDVKVQATDLLDAMRSKVLGFKGVNTRPWLFVGEKPEPAASGDGLAFYSQTWQTALSVVGSSETT